MVFSFTLNGVLLKDEPRTAKKTIQKSTPAINKANRLAKNIFQNDVFLSTCITIDLCYKDAEKQRASIVDLHEWNFILINGIYHSKQKVGI